MPRIAAIVPVFIDTTNRINGMEKLSSFLLGAGIALLILALIERGKTAHSRWKWTIALVLLFLAVATSDYGRGFWDGLTQ